ncbi:putative chromatin regulator PHD family [Medicago truncatula]|uniref:Cysteine/histidine-rich C1 domain protein n=1 Tax=Medicago truncatula TaxID=3880 RepID=G7KXW3_MEDTR|nr:uncharacterized protein LOC11440342 [Medicago truncatula]AES78128.1 cysteine/histidine-rich C1 domain protein [Medicago truncatula]RHN44805.1 putative chromatin regulator PHD family [Medicago truncatula]
MDHQHTLKLNDSGAPSFMCSGCKELGFGSSYSCGNSNCNYILHEECAEPITHAVHPFFNNCTFEFYDKVQEGGFCDACGKDVLGFFYHCSRTGYALHPCCLKLQDKISDKDGNVIMTLCHEVPSDCVHCKQKYVARNQFEGWSYVYSYEKSCVHVSCFNDMILEILNNKNRSRGRKRAFMKFIGKLVVDVLIDIVLMDPTNSITTIAEAIASGFS